MELILFKTDSPFDHVQRALDMLRSMGFQLHSLSVEKAEGERYSVRLQYRPQGDLSPQTLLMRLAQRSGLDILEPRMATLGNGEESAFQASASAARPLQACGR